MITVIQPDPKVTEDRFGPWLRAHGHELDVVQLWERPVPALDECGEGIVVLGGTMNAVDTEASPWLEGVYELLRAAVAADRPVLGICLGHQILAEAFGGEVTVGHKASAEDGPFEMRLLEAGQSDALFAGLPARFIMPESHNDAVTRLPEEAVLLASSDACEVQAFRVGSAVGVQFHPEASPGTMGFWHSLSDGDSAAMVASMNAVDDQVVSGGRVIAENFVAGL